MIVLGAKLSDVLSPGGVAPGNLEKWRCRQCGDHVYLTDNSLGDLVRRQGAKIVCGKCCLLMDGVRNIQPTR